DVVRRVEGERRHLAGVVAAEIDPADPDGGGGRRGAGHHPLAGRVGQVQGGGGPGPAAGGGDGPGVDPVVIGVVAQPGDAGGGVLVGVEEGGGEPGRGGGGAAHPRPLAVGHSGPEL